MPTVMQSYINVLWFTLSLDCYSRNGKGRRCRYHSQYNYWFRYSKFHHLLRRLLCVVSSEEKVSATTF